MTEALYIVLLTVIFLFLSKKKKIKDDMSKIWKGLVGLSACWCLLTLVHCSSETGKKLNFSPTLSFLLCCNRFDVLH